MYYKSVRCDEKYLDRQSISIGHEKFTGWCGRLECELEVLTPLCIKIWEKGPPIRVQGSTIKGMVRSAAEIISQSCFRIGSNPPPRFTACESIEKACTCCRLFGGTFTEQSQDSQESSAFQSKVFFEDTNNIPLNELKEETVHVSAQGCDYDWDGRRVFLHFKPQASGDKFFTVLTAPPGKILKFGVDFECLEDDELGLLLCSLVLEPYMAHKMGYMKSRGLGSVRIKITKLELTRNYSDAFLGYNFSIPAIEDISEIERCAREHIDQYLQRKNLNESDHLQAFRELMKYKEE